MVLGSGPSANHFYCRAAPPSPAARPPSASTCVRGSCRREAIRFPPTDRPATWGLADGHRRILLVATDDHCWLALAAFESGDRLWRSVKALLEDGVSVEQLCLVGLLNAIAKFAPTDSVVDGHLEIARQLQVNARELSHPAGGATVAITNATFQDLLLPTEVGSGAADGASSDRLRDFAPQITRGNVVLVVGSANDKQQVAVTRTLLAHSLDRVTTYDFAMPTAEARPSTAPSR